jgi:hypothetical protein
MTETISEKRKKDFDIILKQKLCCKSRQFNQILMKGNPSELDLLQIEIFLSMECPELYMLIKLYENARIHKINIKHIIDDPTTQE